MAQIHFLRRWQVEAATGLSRSTIYKWMEEGRFPRPVTLGPRVVRWREGDIDAWMASRNADGA